MSRVRRSFTRLYIGGDLHGREEGVDIRPGAKLKTWVNKSFWTWARKRLPYRGADPKRPLVTGLGDNLKKTDNFYILLGAHYPVPQSPQKPKAGRVYIYRLSKTFKP